jgi:prepilin-type N-terminal cleavage/methylation domain-containing protein
MIRYQSTKRGFTLLELLAVMAIMLILASIAVTSYRSMVSGSGINASLGHLKQSLALARQNAIMQGKNAYVVFYQDTNSAWYTTCLGEGTRTDGAGQVLIDRYNQDLASLAVGTVLFNLSEEKAKFSPVTQVEPSTIEGATAIATAESIWTQDAVYGWEITKRIQLPRGFRFKDSPSTVRFKPNGTGGSAAVAIEIYEEIRPTDTYSVRVNMDGSVAVNY